MRCQICRGCGCEAQSFKGDIANWKFLLDLDPTISYQANLSSTQHEKLCQICSHEMHRGGRSAGAVIEVVELLAGTVVVVLGWIVQLLKHVLNVPVA